MHFKNVKKKQREWLNDQNKHETNRFFWDEKKMMTQKKNKEINKRKNRMHETEKKRLNKKKRN